MSSEAITVRDLATALECRFPNAWAEPWDRVGLIIGDGGLTLTGVLVTLDATAEAVARALDAGANVVVTHHPPYLEPPEAVVRRPGPAGTLEAAVRGGVAVISAHTNLDRSPAGASALALRLGFGIEGPLESGSEAVTVVTTYAPGESAEVLIGAMRAAGAGRLGQYAGCAYVSEGTGRFEALDGADPTVTSRHPVPEVRIEMVAPPGTEETVLEACRAAHPYEEPVVLAAAGRRVRGVARLGRVCSWRDGARAGDVAAHVGATLGVRCRIWGDPDRVAARIAVANGSAGSLVEEARVRADVLIAGEVRYHDALNAVASGLCVIEAGHDATEWPLVSVLAEAVREAVGGAAPVFEEPPSVSWATT